MNKKIFGLILAFVLIISQAVCVFAAPSAQVPTGGGNYGDDFTDVINNENALKVIDYINNTDASNAEAIAAINEFTTLSLDGGVLATDFYKTKDAEKTANGMYEFTVYVPNLPDNVKTEDIKGIVFYNSVKKWDIVSPVKLEGKYVTFVTPYMPSALAIYFPTTTTTTSPVTGVVSGLSLSMSLAAVATTVSAIASKKSKED